MEREISGRIAPTALQRQVLECRGFVFGSGEWGLGAGEKNRSLCLFEDLRNTPDSETLHKVRGISNLMEHAQPYMQESALKSEQGDARRETGDGTSRRLLNFFCSVLSPTFSMFSTL